MNDIAIIGAGIAGLHLALQLQQQGLSPTLYAELPAEQMRADRLRNTVLLLGTALGRMRELGVHHWDDPKQQIHEFDFGVKDHAAFGFVTPMDQAMQFIDMRLSLPRLLEDFGARGGKVVTCGRLDSAGVADLGKSHDLVVVAAGSGPLANMFPKVVERSPHDEPQRRVMAGLFRGIRFPEPGRFSLQLIPGLGEISEFQVVTAGDADPRLVNGILLEAVPGSPLERMTTLSHDDDPAAFNQAMLETLRDYHPKVFERIEDSAAFGSLGSHHLVQGAVVPIVRRGVVELQPGRFALALGDTHITHDPIIGQGANAAARASWFLGEQLSARAAGGGAFDRDFCHDTEQKMWELLEPVTYWCNASMGPPPDHIFPLLAAAHEHPALAKAYIANNDDPRTQWATISDPAATAAFIQQHTAQASSVQLAV